MLSIHPEREGYPVHGWESLPCYDPQDLAEKVRSSVWSHIIFAAGHRKEHFFHCAYYFVLDVDEGMTKAQAREKFKDYYAILTPTKSDGIEKRNKKGVVTKPACDRYRIIIPFDKPCFNIDVYRYTTKVLTEQFGGDMQAIDAARVWQPSTDAQWIRPDLDELGQRLEWIYDVPEEETTEHKNKQIKSWLDDVVTNKKLPTRAANFMNGNIKPGKRNQELFYTACVLLAKGWSTEKLKDMVYSLPEMEGHEDVDTTIKSAARRVGAIGFETE